LGQGLETRRAGGGPGRRRLTPSPCSTRLAPTRFSGRPLDEVLAVHCRSVNETPSTNTRDRADPERLAGSRPFVDYSSQMRIAKSPALRVTYRILGLFFLGLGILGYLLPGLPGTVFILIAAYFFAQSSPRFYNWLMNHKVFGRWIRDFRAGKGVPLWVKVCATSMIVLSSGLSIGLVFLPRGQYLIAAAVVLVGAYGVYYLLRLPTRRAD